MWRTAYRTLSGLLLLALLSLDALASGSAPGCQRRGNPGAAANDARPVTVRAAVDAGANAVMLQAGHGHDEPAPASPAMTAACGGQAALPATVVRAPEVTALTMPHLLVTGRASLADAPRLFRPPRLS